MHPTSVFLISYETGQRIWILGPILAYLVNNWWRDRLSCLVGSGKLLCDFSLNIVQVLHKGWIQDKDWHRQHWNKAGMEDTQNWMHIQIPQEQLQPRKKDIDQLKDLKQEP